MRRKRWASSPNASRRPSPSPPSCRCCCRRPPCGTCGAAPAPRSGAARRCWVAAAFVNFVGPIAYFTFGRRTQRR